MNQEQNMEVSGDERHLLRVFRSLSKEDQNKFLVEIGTKALFSVCPDIEEDDQEDLKCHLLQFGPAPPDVNLRYALEFFNFTDCILGLSGYDDVASATLARRANIDLDDTHASFSEGGTISPEEVKDFLADWREKVVAEIEGLAAAKKLNPPPSNPSASGATVVQRVAFKMEQYHPTKGEILQGKIAKEMAKYLILVQGHSALDIVDGMFRENPSDGPSLSRWEKRENWADQLAGWLDQRLTLEQAQEFWKELASEKNPKARMDRAWAMLENLTCRQEGKYH